MQKTYYVITDKERVALGLQVSIAKNNLSQMKLAKQLGLSQGTISQLIRKSKEKVTKKVYKALEEVFIKDSMKKLFKKKKISTQKKKTEKKKDTPYDIMESYLDIVEERLYNLEVFCYTELQRKKKWYQFWK